MSDPCKAPIDLSSEVSSSPLGLSLRKSQSFLDFIQMRLSRDIPPGEVIRCHNLEPPNLGNDGKGCLSMTEKRKASNFPAKMVKIGRWKIDAETDGELVAKVYFVKKKLVWEMQENESKRKMEMQWIDISAIKVTYGDELDTLEIELSQPPMFYREVNPQPRKHTTWQATSDFTYRQATFCRMHYLEFPAGYLQKNYEKLLACDPRLQQLNQKDFPSHPTYFTYIHQDIHDLPPKFNVPRSRFAPVYNQPSGNWCASQFSGAGKPQVISSPNQPMGDFGHHAQPIVAFSAMQDLEPYMGAGTMDSFDSGIDYTTIKEHAVGVIDPRNWYFGNINMSLADENAGMMAVFNDINPVFDNNNIENTSLSSIVQNLDIQTQLQQNAPAPNFNPRLVSADHCTAGPHDSFDQNKIESFEEYVLSDSHVLPCFNEEQIMERAQSFSSLINEPDNLGSQLQIPAFDVAHCNF